MRQRINQTGPPAAGHRTRAKRGHNIHYQNRRVGSGFITGASGHIAPS